MRNMNNLVLINKKMRPNKNIISLILFIQIYYLILLNFIFLYFPISISPKKYQLINIYCKNQSVISFRI